MDDKKTIAILLGDAAGIGPELVAKTCSNGFIQSHCHAIILGDRRVFDQALALIGSDFAYYLIEDPEVPDFSNELCFYDMKNVNPDDVVLGQVSAITGRAVTQQIDLGIDLWRKGVVGAICFAPFNKASIKAAKGKEFTSEIAYIRQVLDYQGPAGEINHMKHIFTTRAMSHVPMVDIAKYLTKDNIKIAIRLLWSTMKNAGYENPRIGVAALNPHAGEYGTCGNEEGRIIAPSIREIEHEGIFVTGPYAADTIFNRALNHGEFDGVVTMYHDQGQIALKLLGFEHGVSIIGGLPCPMCSPSHGTAFEIAGKGEANTHPFELAVLDAIALAK